MFWMFSVTELIIFSINTSMFSALLDVTNMVDIVIVIIQFINLHMEYFIDIYAFYSSDNVFESNYIYSQSIVTASITIYNGLLDMSINCLFFLKNCCMSYYKSIYWFCGTFTQSTMAMLSTNQLELMIYCPIEMIKSNYKYISDIYDKNKPTIERNIQCYKHTCCNCISIAMNYIVILIVQVVRTVDLFAYCLDIYILYKRNHVIKSNYTNIQSIFRAGITIFNGLFDICIILRKLFINCIVWLQNSVKSHYRFLYWCCCRLIHLPVVLAYINQLELSIYRTIEMIEANIKDIKNTYAQNETQNNKNIQSYNSIFCTSINYILMMIVEVICIIFVFYELMEHLSIQKQTLIHVYCIIFINGMNAKCYMIRLMEQL